MIGCFSFTESCKAGYSGSDVVGAGGAGVFLGGVAGALGTLMWFGPDQQG